MSQIRFFTDEDVYAAVALLHLGQTLSAEAMQDRIEYLGNW